MPYTNPALLAQLNATSEVYRDPLTGVDWTKLSLDDWWLPADCISLAGLSDFEALPEHFKKSLSQYEFVYFLHAGLWLEQIFMARLSGALRRTGSAQEYAAHLHEIREEAGHSLMYLKLMDQSGLHLPAGTFHPPGLADFIGQHAPMDSTLFWLAVNIGEALPDQFNRHIRAAGDAINPVISRMCMLHMIDEARHIARARSVLDHASMGPIKCALLSPILSTLLDQFVRSLFLPSPAIYELAGLAPGVRWSQAARHNSQRLTFMQQCAGPTITLLGMHGYKVQLPRF